MKGEISERYRQANKIELQIVDNEKEIRALTSKIIKNDYDQHELNKLNEKRKRLLQKKQENDEFLRNQHMLERLTFQEMKHQRDAKNQLNNQYKTFLQQRQNTERQTERRRIIQQQEILRAAQDQIYQDKQREKQLHELYRRRAISDLDFKHRLKDLKKANEEKQKAEFKQRYQQSINQLNPKTNSYRGYYEHFRGVQNKIQENYLQSVAPVNSRRQMSKQELVNKGIEQANRRSQQTYAESVNRSMDMKRDLRDYLKKQMQAKELRKSQQKANQYQEGVQQLNTLQYIAQIECHRINQAKQQRKFPKQNDQGSKQPENQRQSLNNQSSSYQNRRFSQPHFIPQKKLYNPITNPIDFKIGIQNPYVLQQLSKAKQQLSGDPNLKINNLALLGSSSLYRR